MIKSGLYAVIGTAYSGRERSAVSFRFPPRPLETKLLSACSAIWVRKDTWHFLKSWLALGMTVRQDWPTSQEKRGLFLKWAIFQVVLGAGLPAAFMQKWRLVRQWQSLLEGKKSLYCSAEWISLKSSKIQSCLISHMKYETAMFSWWHFFTV